MVFAQGGLSGMAEPECVPSSSYAQGGSSSRRAVISSSRPAGSTEVGDSSRSLSNKIGRISLRSSGVQQSPLVASADPKRMVTSRHQSSNMRNYEAALKADPSLSLELE